MKKITCLLIICSVLMSCNLEELPKSAITKKPVFSTEKGLEMYTNSFYNQFPNRTVLTTHSYYIAYNSVIPYLTQNGFSAEESRGWSWDDLVNINYFITNCNDPAVSESIRNNYLGIARFFRAYFYFNKMKRFGDLPWINKPLSVNDPQLYSARDPRTLIVDSIKADLDFAIKHIKTDRDMSSSSITSSVAAALKSRICLWEGTYRKYHTEAGLSSSADEWLREAVNAAEIVMKSGYSIYQSKGTDASYRELFIARKPIAEEVLYATTFNGQLGLIHAGNRSWTSLTYGNAPSLTRSFVNTYLTLDGTPYTDNPNYTTGSFVEECKNRDLRLSQTIRTPGFTRIKGGDVIAEAPNYAYAITGYHTSKFTLDDTKYDNDDICDNNIIIFRYAETLLNYAEAKAELGILTDEDWSKSIGELRKRAGIKNGLNSKPTVADPYLQKRFFPQITNPEILEIRRERGIELSFEGFSWSDVCRWKLGERLTDVWDGIYIPELEVPYDMDGDGTLDVCFTLKQNPEKVKGVYYLYVGATLSNGAVNNTQLADDGHTLLFMKDQKRRWDEKLYFYPIPANDLVMNPKLKQNPGW